MRDPRRREASQQPRKISSVTALGDPRPAGTQISVHPEGKTRRKRRQRSARATGEDGILEVYSHRHSTNRTTQVPDCSPRSYILTTALCSRLTSTPLGPDWKACLPCQCLQPPQIGSDESQPIQCILHEEVCLSSRTLLASGKACSCSCCVNLLTSKTSRHGPGIGWQRNLPTSGANVLTTPCSKSSPWMFCNLRAGKLSSEEPILSLICLDPSL